MQSAWKPRWFLALLNWFDVYKHIIDLSDYVTTVYSYKDTKEQRGILLSFFDMYIIKICDST